jgi:hypothetical protein
VWSQLFTGCRIALPFREMCMKIYTHLNSALQTTAALPPKMTLVTIKIRLKDYTSEDADFLPPNVFTPDGDGCNDYFALEGIELCPFNPDQTSNPDKLVALPPDNCLRKFETVRIYNRWGKQVFTSQQRNFRWYGNDMAAGVYYYVVQYTDKEYKGSVTIVY